MKLHTGMGAGTNRCPKCNGEVVQGFTCGREGPNRVVSTWVEGAPEKVGTLFRQVRKVPEAKCVPAGTFRCSACGFLESYARPEFGLGSYAPIALDYRQSIDCPTVIRHRWSERAERNRRVYVAPSFSQFAEMLEL